tara:strand:- start:10244 stop:11059 length:816 start_codon:yes stop_codon:yes gene_type:complete
VAKHINVSIIGKPNVGKSTIFNKLIGSNISKVSEKSGTTVYPILFTNKFKDLSINLIDLGGLKKKSKSHENKQQLITSETIKQLNYSDLVFFVMDGSDEVTKNDKQLFRLILNKLKNVIIIINKTDLIKKDLKRKENYFKFFFDKNYPNILLKPIFISALKTIKKEFLLKKIFDIHSNSNKIFNNQIVNKVLKTIIEKHQPVYSKNSRPNIKFLRHVNSKPMIFKAFGNKLTYLNREYKNYFVKQLLSNLNIHNQIVIIKYINNKNPFKKN